MSIKKNISFIFFTILLFTLFGCSSTSSKISIKVDNPNKSELVKTEGSAPIIDNNLLDAKKTAIHDALKNALNLVVGVYVSQESLVSKSILIEDNITSQTEGYIEKYQILKEWQENNFYKVKIEALVKKEDISSKIKALDLEPKKLGNPIIKFQIEEQIDNEISNNNYAVNELKKTVHRSWIFGLRF